MLRTTIIAALLVPSLAAAQQPLPPAIDLREGSVSVGPPPPAGPPAGPEVPFVIKCYRRDTVPFVLSDKDGKVLFEIRCPP